VIETNAMRMKLIEVEGPHRVEKVARSIVNADWRIVPLYPQELHPIK
jgi:hypothetical protein